MKYNQPANYTDDLKAVVTKPSPRGDGNWVMEVEPKDENGNQLFTGDNPGSVSIEDAMIVIPTDAQGVKRTKQLETVTNLAANATYTGVTIDTSAERRIVGIVSANQAGTLYVESSTNGSTWYSIFKQNIAANTPFGFDVPCYTEYTRIKYTNGNTAQTAFRLAAYTLPI
ncbi:MAG TPA: hypothetical protein PL004_11480 [Bacillota bacterium]|mgnify:FL=1|nr:hypothetical protein [Bacillota bacterium]